MEWGLLLAKFLKGSARYCSWIDEATRQNLLDLSLQHIGVFRPDKL